MRFDLRILSMQNGNENNRQLLEAIFAKMLAVFEAAYISEIDKVELLERALEALEHVDTREESK